MMVMLAAINGDSDDNDGGANVGSDGGGNHEYRRGILIMRWRRDVGDVFVRCVCDVLALIWRCVGDALAMC